MSGRLIFALLLVSAVLVTGCPYDAKVPLGEPRADSLDSRLLGPWVWRESSGSVTRILVLPFNRSEYYVETREYDEEPQRYRAYIVEVSGEPFLNLSEVEAAVAPGSFSFARYSFSAPGTLSLRFVGDKGVPKALESDQKSLVDFLAAHRNDPSLDDVDIALVLTRPGFEDPPPQPGTHR